MQRALVNVKISYSLDTTEGRGHKLLLHQRSKHGLPPPQMHVDHINEKMGLTPSVRLGVVQSPSSGVC